MQLWLKPKDDIDLDDLAALFTEYGFKVEHTHASLKANLFNHATATYTLLEELRDP